MSINQAVAKQERMPNIWKYFHHDHHFHLKNSYQCSTFALVFSWAINIQTGWFFKIRKHLQQKVFSVPPLKRMFWTVGCQTTSPTLLWCAAKSTTGSSRFLSSPPSGICHTFTVQSSEALAMMSSLCGHHWMSSTAALWPTTRGASRSTRPLYKVINRTSFIRKIMCRS